MSQADLVVMVNMPSRSPRHDGITVICVVDLFQGAAGEPGRSGSDGKPGLPGAPGMMGLPGIQGDSGPPVCIV